MKTKLNDWDQKVYSNVGRITESKFGDGSSYFHGSVRTKFGIVEVDFTYVGDRSEYARMSIVWKGREYTRVYDTSFTKRGVIVLAGRFARHIATLKRANAIEVK